MLCAGKIEVDDPSIDIGKKIRSNELFSRAGIETQMPREDMWMQGRGRRGWDELRD